MKFDSALKIPLALTIPNLYASEKTKKGLRQVMEVVGRNTQFLLLKSLSRRQASLLKKKGKEKL